MSTKAQAPLSPKAVEVLEALKTLPEGATLADLKNVVEGANSAHLTALRSRGMVEAVEVEVETVKVTKSKVLKYSAK